MYQEMKLRNPAQKMQEHFEFSVHVALLPNQRLGQKIEDPSELHQFLDIMDTQRYPCCQVCGWLSLLLLSFFSLLSPRLPCRALSVFLVLCLIG